MDLSRCVQKVFINMVLLLICICLINASFSMVVSQENMHSKERQQNGFAYPENPRFGTSSQFLESKDPKNYHEYVLYRLRRSTREGLLKSKYIKAKYVQSPYISSDKLKANKISSDKIIAKSVIVTKFTPHTNERNADTSSYLNESDLRQFIEDEPSGFLGLDVAKHLNMNKHRRKYKRIIPNKTFYPPRLKRIMNDLQNPRIPAGIDFLTPGPKSEKLVKQNPENHTINLEESSNSTDQKNGFHYGTTQMELKHLNNEKEGLQGSKNKTNLDMYVDKSNSKSPTNDLQRIYRKIKIRTPPSDNGHLMEHINKKITDNFSNQSKSKRNIYDIQSSVIHSELVEPSVQIKRLRPRKKFKSKSFIHPFGQILQIPERSSNFFQMDALPVLAENEGSRVTQEMIGSDSKFDQKGNSGLLKVKQILSGYMKAHSTVADRIKADVVSSKMLEVQYIKTRKKNQDENLRQY